MKSIKILLAKTIAAAGNLWIFPTRRRICRQSITQGWRWRVLTAKSLCRRPLWKQGKTDQTKPMTKPEDNRVTAQVRVTCSGTALVPGDDRLSGIRNNCTVAVVCDCRLIIKTALIERFCIGREWCNFKPEAGLGK